MYMFAPYYETTRYLSFSVACTVIQTNQSVVLTLVCLSIRNIYFNQHINVEMDSERKRERDRQREREKERE